MKKKENIIIIVVLLVMILAIIGVSYAAFNFSKTGTKVNSITTGSITMTYTETDNTISLSGALPTTDKTGKVRLTEGEYFDFTVSSKIAGDVNINYEISAKDVTTSDKKIDGSNIKLYLTRLTDDGEEELMTPETYNEEATANDYTGRPSGEMSLYTSSMNSSESNRYRLRMYVDEDYNPQGDGGNLQFTVQINVYGKDGDKYVPLTTQEILEDNELQEEKTNMFNYASNGNYLDMNSMSQQNNPEYVTNGLYSMDDEDGISYYYRGNVTNNNVQFGEYTEDYYIYDDGYFQTQTLENCEKLNSGQTNRCEKTKLASKGDKMYWKIVRINGDGSLRLLYNGINNNQEDVRVGRAPYNLTSDDSKYTGYTYDRDTNEIDSFIKEEVDEWYNNALGDTIYDNMAIKGRFCNDTSGYQLGTNYGFTDVDYNVFASYDRLVQSYTNYAKPNSPTLKCPSTSENYGGNYRLKAGLMTADELVLAGASFSVFNLDIYFKSNGITSMTPGSNNMNTNYPYSSIFIVHPFFDQYINQSSDVVGFPITPVINVSVDTGFTSGDGTSENPYVIE